MFMKNKIKKDRRILRDITAAIKKFKIYTLTIL